MPLCYHVTTVLKREFFSEKTSERKNAQQVSSKNTATLQAKSSHFFLFVNLNLFIKRATSFFSFFQMQVNVL